MKISSESDQENSEFGSCPAEEKPFLENRDTARQLHRSRVKLVAHILIPSVAILLSFTAGYIVCLARHIQDPLGSYEDGFRSEIPLPIHVPLREVRFTGSPRFFDNGTSWRPKVDPNTPWPDNETYFGPPSDEIDANWKRLLMPSGMSISEDEAKSMWGDSYMEYWNEDPPGFTAVLDVFHTLHCLDFVRKAFYQERYPFTPVHGEIHLEHCLDTIRQSIQCYGSTNLVPTKFVDSLGHLYIDSEQIHACRDIRVLRKWVDERQPGGKYYQERKLG
ncbi:hypothetical protein F5884DRAFT_849441 [Xylogone sp. PMI_703]|nr:hypothetical protein F5884DRAFT_849441 [Xylogone sp. PMI_703]